MLAPILPGGAAPGVDQRSRSAGRLEKFLSRVILRTSEGRLSNDSKGLGMPGAKKHIRMIGLFNFKKPSNFKDLGNLILNVYSKSGRFPEFVPSDAPFRRGILDLGRGIKALAPLPVSDCRVSQVNHPGGMRTSLPTKVLARNSSCARRMSDRGKVFATSGRISPRSM